MGYYTQNTIANDPAMRARVAQAAAQEGCTDAGVQPDSWVVQWARIWASAPGWDAAWESAEAGNVENPGEDATVITDAMILSQVQAMKPFAYIGQHVATPAK